jgi:hypothetical protein
LVSVAHSRSTQAVPVERHNLARGFIAASSVGVLVVDLEHEIAVLKKEASIVRSSMPESNENKPADTHIAEL